MPFFLDGQCNDPAYRNTRDLEHEIARKAKAFVENLWIKYQHLADSNFRTDARNHFLQRFWEMYLAVTLLERGFDVKKHGDEGPEYYIESRGRRIWFEAIAPNPGTGADQVPQLEYGSDIATEVPTEQILLRFTHALSEKQRKYCNALDKEIISDEDSYVLAINSRGIPNAPYGNTMPYYLQAFLPIGPLACSIDRQSGKIIEQFYQHRPSVTKQSGKQISTMSFLEESASFCSAVLHSGVDCANHPEQMGDDFSILFNPNTNNRLNEDDFDWCERFIVKDDELVKLERKNEYR